MTSLHMRPRRAPVRLTLSVGGRAVEAEVALPVGRRRLDELLPVLRSLDDALVDGAVADEAADGRAVSCAKGCAACCKAQPVPVTPPEALALARLVQRLPEPRRTAIRAAFAAAVARLAEAGLLDAYMDRSRELTRAEAMAIATAYFSQRIACPFLVDDACSIYDERPFVCRQYLVTSPPALCADPLGNAVRPVPMPARFASTMLELAERRLGTPQHSLPLVLALLYVERRGRELERTFEARELFAEFMQALAPGPASAGTP